MRRGVPGLTLVLFLTLVGEINIKEMHTEEGEEELCSVFHSFKPSSFPLVASCSCSSNDSIIILL